MQELVSVIVPIYNSEKYLDMCIRSIVHQTYKKIEILLINDGSTDASLEICNNWAMKDARVKVITKENGGEASARNEGIKNAKGKYISFVDNDDYIELDMLKNMVCAIEKNKCQGAVCSFFYENEDGCDLKWRTPEYKGSRIVSGEEACKMFLTSRNIEGFTWNKMFLREQFVKKGIVYGGYPPDILASFQLLFSCDNVVLVDKKMYHYRQVTTSLVHTPKLEKAMQLCNTTQKIYEMAKMYGLSKEAEIYKIFRNIYNMFDYWKLRRTIGKDWKRYIAELSWEKTVERSTVSTIRILIDSDIDQKSKMIFKVIVCRIVY